VYVDEDVHEQGDPVYDFDVLPRHRIIPCGPFYGVDRLTRLDTWIDATAFEQFNIGVVNKAGLIKDQLAPVVVNSKGELADLFMIVPRVRRLLRKHQQDVENPYELIVDEAAALQGLLKWRLETSTPVCYGGATPGAAQCYRSPKATIVFQETHLPLCAHHQLEHQNRLSAERVASKGAHPANR